MPPWPSSGKDIGIGGAAPGAPFAADDRVVGRVAAVTRRAPEARAPPATLRSESQQWAGGHGSPGGAGPSDKSEPKHPVPGMGALSPPT